jgi:NAD(P)-dependent dehydrogenase (short-subunit alcohol dehydrogenase family)
VAVVTGGSRGIGLMAARGLVEAGAHVVITSRDADACAAAVAELGAGCEALPHDLSDPGEVDAFAAELAGRHDAIDVLVNNAGATWGAPIADYPVAGWDKVMDLNVRSVFLLTRALLPQLRAAGGTASVINIGSIDGLRVPAFESYAYSASKAAVHHLTRHLAAQLAPDVRVNAIAPGLFPSKMTRFMLDAAEQQIVDQTPLRRIGEPDDIAGIVRFLAARASAFVTGAVVPVDGGVATCR